MTERKIMCILLEQPIYHCRVQFLNVIALNEEQPAWVPKFTEVGFQKTAVPADVYSMLLSEYVRQLPNMYEEECPKDVINCEEIIYDEMKAQSSLVSSRRSFMIELRLSFITLISSNKDIL